MTRTTLKSLLLAASIALPAAAQTPSQTAPQTTQVPPGGAVVPPGAQATTPPEAEQTPQQREKAVDAHIQEMHTRLAITAAQEPAWNRFASAMRTQAHEADETYTQREKAFDSTDALDNLKSYAAMAKQHAQHVAALVPPFEALYTSFSPEQKKAADEYFRYEHEKHEQEHQQEKAGQNHG